MASSPKVWAELVSHGNAEWAMRFVEGEARAFTVGRHPTSSLVLEDKHISSKHLSVAQRVDAHGRQQVYVEDSSTNGTWLNGDRLIKGERVTLADGAEIQLPSEDTEWRNYSFRFRVLAVGEAAPVGPGSPLGAVAEGSEEGSDSGGETAPLSYEPAGSANGGALTRAEAAFVLSEETESNEQWRELDKLQEQLAREASRLAASVFGNSATALALEAAAREVGSGAALAELERANAQLVRVIEGMVASMRAGAEVLRSAPSVSDADRGAVLHALNLERYERALRALQAQAPEPGR
jgi:hypothetical protein